MKEKVQKLLKISKDCNLLYVEDNKDARDSTLKLLERFFENITIAVNGKDGFDKFSKNKNFDLIITDINMPVMDGIEMLTKIRKVDKDIASIVLSAHNEQIYIDKAEELNVSDYLTKPIILSKLIESLLSNIKIKEIA
jgi:YesN/AraC family two-component response regulator